MTHHGAVSSTFPTHAAARAAKDRLVRAGFARNSIDIDRDGDAFEVRISTREENRARVERVLKRSPLADDLRRTGAAALDGLSGNRALALGLAALAGFALYGLTQRR